MSTTLTCDKCGEQGNAFTILASEHAPWWTLGGRYDGEEFRFDVCHDCAKELIRWFDPEQCDPS